MNYEPKFITGMTVEEIDVEMKADYERLYRYGYAIDRPRHWDLEYTKKILMKKEATKMNKIKVSIDSESIKAYVLEFASAEDARDAYETAIDWMGMRLGIYDAEEVDDEHVCIVCTNDTLHGFAQELGAGIEWE